jgi:hypothetical protein
MSLLDGLGGLGEVDVSARGRVGREEAGWNPTVHGPRLGRKDEFNTLSTSPRRQFALEWL